MTATDPLPKKTSGLPGFLASLLVFATLGVVLLWPALGPAGQMLSAAGFWTHHGPFPTALSRRAPPDLTVLSDSVQQFTPWLRYAADHTLRDGRLPLWKDTASCGAPLLGNGQSAMFFPPMLLSIVLGAPFWVYAMQALVKFVGGALCAWLLARHLGLSVLAAILCGLTFGFGGFQSVWLTFPHTNVSMLLPLLLFASDRVVLAPSLRRVGLLALVAGLQHLGGHPETAFHCQTIAVACALVRCIALRRGAARSAGSAGGAGPAGRGAWVGVGGVLAGLVLGAGVGAVQTLPLLEYMARSEAVHSRAQVTDFPALREPGWTAAFAVAVVASVLAFRWLARTARSPWLPALVLLPCIGAALVTGMQAGLTPTCVQVLAADWNGGPTRYLGNYNYVTDNGAFGGAALALAVLGLLHGRPRGVVKLLALAVGLGLLAAYHAPLLTDLLNVLPVFKLAANQRLALMALLAIALLAGFGLDALGRGAGEHAAGTGADATGPGADAARRGAHAARRGASTARGRLRVALALVVPVLAMVGALAVCVSTGLLAGSNQPPGPRGTSRLKVTLVDPAAGAALDAYLPEPTRCSEPVLPLMLGRTFSGIVSSPQPLSGARLVYGRDASSVYARTVPLADVATAANIAPPTRSGHAYAFRAVAPRGDFLPEPTDVRLWVHYLGGGVELSEILHAPDGSGSIDRPWLLFPARPVPGGADTQLMLLGAMALLAVLALHASGRWRMLARTAMVALAAAGIGLYASGLLPLLPRDLFFPTSQPLRVLKQLAPDARMLNMRRFRLGPEVATWYGIPDVDGYDALFPRRTAALLHAAVDDFASGARAPAEPGRPFDTRLLGLMAVKDIADVEGSPDSPDVTAWRFDDNPCTAPFLIADNPHYLPRARLVGGTVIEADDERALDLLRDPGFPRESCVVLPEGRALAPPNADPGSAAIVMSRPEQVRVAIEPTAAGFLVLADTWFPGWKALVDGHERPIERANTAFRAVAVRPGDHLVEFRYEPFWFRCGAIVSAGCGALALLACLIRPRRQAPRTHEGVRA